MITIMTPTYNRAYILEKAYISLINQTSQDFEWIIVDDGSSDHTEQLVRQWQGAQNAFDIVYFKQPNGGKHRAVNRAVNMARYDWFLILDSDDHLTETAVQTIHNWIDDVSEQKGIVGVAGLRGSTDKPIGGTPKQKYVDATNLERKKYGLLGDKAEIYKTAIMKKYPFPEFEGENFLRESAVWDHIAKDGLKLRWYNEVIYLCEYIEDGLTKNTNDETYSKNFQGFTYCTKLFLQTHSGLLWLNKCGHYCNVARRKGVSKREAAQLLGVSMFALTLGRRFFRIKQIIKRYYMTFKAFIRSR